MLNLQRHARGSAVGASPPPLLQQVLTEFVAGQLPLLILKPTDFRRLHLLGVKAHQFERQRPDGATAAQTLHPGQHILHPAEARRGLPPWRSPPVAKSGWSIPGMSLPPAPAHPAPLVKGVLDLLPAMRQFRRPDRSEEHTSELQSHSFI